MTVTESLLSYALAAGILTLTPGLDTALVLRTAASQGSKKALLSAFGISTGCLIWGAMVALGLGAVLAASEMAFTLLKWTGAAYLAWRSLSGLARFADAAQTAKRNEHGRAGGQRESVTHRQFSVHKGIIWQCAEPESRRVLCFFPAAVCRHRLSGRAVYFWTRRYARRDRHTLVHHHDFRHAPVIALVAPPCGGQNT